MTTKHILKSFFDSDDIRAFTSAKSITAKHPKNLFFVCLNINSIRNKFVSIKNSSKAQLTYS